MIRFIATFGYSGHLPKAPGTWGSLAGAFLIALLSWIGTPIWLYVLLGALCFFVGWWATAKATAGKADHDPSEIVIDEVAGMFVACLVPFAVWAPEIPFDAPLYVQDSELQWVAIAALALSFALFRLFDIWKPWPVSWADRKSTAFGVMLDDVLAGFLALCLLAIILLGPAVWVYLTFDIEEYLIQIE